MTRVIFPSLDANAPLLTEALGSAFDDSLNTPSLLLVTDGSGGYGEVPRGLFETAMPQLPRMHEAREAAKKR